MNMKDFHPLFTHELIILAPWSLIRLIDKKYILIWLVLVFPVLHVVERQTYCIKRMWLISRSKNWHKSKSISFEAMIEKQHLPRKWKCLSTRVHGYLLYYYLEHQCANSSMCFIYQQYHQHSIAMPFVYIFCSIYILYSVCVWMWMSSGR